MAQVPQSGPVSPPKPIRVGLVAAGDTLRRLGPLVRTLMIGLLDEPMSVALICPAEADVSSLPAPPVEVIRYRPARWSFLGGRGLDRLAGEVRRLGVTFLHALDEDALALTRNLAARAELEALVSVYSLATPAQLAEARLPAVLAASEPVRQALLAARAAPAERIGLLRPGVHAAHSADCFTNPQYLPALVAAGDFEDAAPFAAALDAFAALRREGRQCAYFLVGNGRAESALRRHAQRLELMPDLTFVDPQGADRLAGVLKPADVLVWPAAPRRVELELLEAMAAGVPVVCAGGPAPDFILDGQTALTFRAGNAAELASRLAGLLDDIPAARGLAENALEHLRAHHSPAAMVAQLSSLYRDLAAGRAPRVLV